MKSDVRKALPLLILLAVMVAAFAAMSLFGERAKAETAGTLSLVPAKRPTRSETRSLLQASAQTQQAIQDLLAKLQQLKMNHIAKTKLATPNDKLILTVYDRLIGGVEARYLSGDLADFLKEYTLRMAETEKLNNSNLTVFFLYLGDVIKAAKNDRSDIVSTIESYMRSAPLDKPLSAARFILNHSYSNGLVNEGAVGLSREDATPDEPLPEPPPQETEASILPLFETPQLLPPEIISEDAVETGTESLTPVAQETATQAVPPVPPQATSDKVDKKIEPVPEKTLTPDMTTPLSDSSETSVPPALSNLSADSQAGYSESEPRPRRESQLEKE